MLLLDKVSGGKCDASDQERRSSGRAGVGGSKRVAGNGNL